MRVSACFFDAKRRTSIFKLVIIIIMGLSLSNLIYFLYFLFSISALFSIFVFYILFICIYVLFSMSVLVYIYLYIYIYFFGSRFEQASLTTDFHFLVKTRPQ